MSSKLNAVLYIHWLGLIRTDYSHAEMDLHTRLVMAIKTPVRVLNKYNSLMESKQKAHRLLVLELRLSHAV